MLKIENLESGHKLVLDDAKYGKEYRLIEAIFKEFPKNDDINAISQKIAIIDVTNSTNLARHKRFLSLCDVAYIILNSDFDKRVAIGDVSLVRDISKKSKDDFGINLFSFASKYCCYHNSLIYGRDDYSIFDSVISNHLHEYSIESYRITKTKPEDWRQKFQYQEFNEFIGNILKANGITNNVLPGCRRMFDHYLWYKYRKQ